ncbi:hypothetical protein DNP20_24635, partial [Salmonella enterica subsp. enterica serovar Panama]|uniref:VaFE repeat-containing surface-anchored protein n=1 Tax=Salmonella enterica TaxID=28901 RepID=UPI0011976668
PVASAVAFERLTSVEVNADGDETPGVSSDKPNDIAQHENPKDQDQTVDSKETLTPSIGTKAEFAKDSSEPRVVNGATVEDTVTYEGLVAGKKYHLDAKLVDPEDPENPDAVYGTGKADFVAAEGGKGSEVVTIKVDNAEK